MGGVAYVNWTARSDMMNGLRSRHLRKATIAEGCYQTRKHIRDRGLYRDDEFVPIGLIELATQSVTCEILDPEEMMIQAEEAALADYEAGLAEDYTAEITDSSSKEPDQPEQEEPAEPSLSDYFAQLFGLNKPATPEMDEFHFGIPCQEAVPRYRSRPNWATTL